MTDSIESLEWVRVAAVNELPPGRVKTVTAGTHSMALTNIDGEFTAMDNRCPHQGGPLGEGSIEVGEDGQCWLRCPWHGWDFDPKTGRSPGGHEDSGQRLFPVDVRDGEVYIGLEAEPAREATAADVMARTMTNWGVRSVFGIVGHSNLGLADALRLEAKEGRLNYYGVRHEGAAAFACSGYSKLTGKPAACLSIAGPGATNMVTGLWDAKVDRAPVLALTGQVDVQVFGPGAFQDIDLTAAFAPVAHYSQTVLHTSRFAELMNLACKNAIVERDVAHLIFPNDVQTLPAGDAKPTDGPEGRVAAARIAPDAGVVQEMVSQIEAAKRPIIIAGYGALEGMSKVIALAEKLNAPVLTTFKAKGQIPDQHPLAAGVLGRSGTPVASWFMNKCDLILAFGSSFSNHTGITPVKPIIQVDFDRMALGKFHKVTLPVWGDIGRTAQLVLGKLPDTPDTVDQRQELAQRWHIWREEKESRVQDDRGKGLNSAVIFHWLGELVPEDAVIAVDVGNNTYSFGRYFESKGQRVLMSGYLGSIGFAFAAAMGAWAATQEAGEYRGRKVVSISGDGGFGQYLGDFTTAVKYNMDITHVLLNNSELGKISKEQRAGEWPVWETDLHNPNFAAFAKLCGAQGFRVTEASEFPIAFEKALQHPGPALVEVITDANLV
ncbi:thiamine pyrophosphate-dependent enzyme [Microbulbifer agarilyticus]|uniref:thiamine pyrophosphate-dependent enzyme n=1 Tax=Microbulbifer agarilyticus TaxID=260552 RepID=UPI001CD6958D|nr:thiamine pyrophosphate-dependent enzyme [Microbulbifer agarilyticus]MCA0899119.1 Rieske 2Fe-2S domain-containing protein [Microbulbifer agarilyticus]